MPRLYDTLREMAAVRLRREGAQQTLEPTALVHEALAHLVGAVMGWQNLNAITGTTGDMTYATKNHYYQSREGDAEDFFLRRKIPGARQGLGLAGPRSAAKGLSDDLGSTNRNEDDCLAGGVRGRVRQRRQS